MNRRLALILTAGGLVLAAGVLLACGDTDVPPG
ncbi:MAG: hypothetical protein H6P95_2101, partial [Candidatus Aminicenantes bacterium]|nr:hypothetical protein [Candidatus Aminicenantes bacterium]